MAIVQPAAALPQLLATKEVCSLLGCSRATLWRLFQRHELRRVTVGRSVKVPASEIHAYVERKLAECA